MVGDNTADQAPDLYSGKNSDGTATSVFAINHSLIENTAGAQIDDAANNIFGADPQLGALQNNGGATETILPNLGSPLIDAGIANGLSSDQRGQARTFDSLAFPNVNGSDGTDIGATELQPGENGLPANGECKGAPAIAKTGTESGETITGTESVDLLTGAGGDDTLQGLGANDCLSGDAGNDTADGGAGADLITGGAGKDTLKGRRRQGQDQGLGRQGQAQGRQGQGQGLRRRRQGQDQPRQGQGQGQGRRRQGQDQHRRRQEGQAQLRRRRGQGDRRRQGQGQGQLRRGEGRGLGRLPRGGEPATAVV